MRVFLEEVMLDRPGVVDAQPVGELHLVERILHQLALVVGPPGLGQLQLVEDPEFHRRLSALRVSPTGSDLPALLASPCCHPGLGRQCESRDPGYKCNAGYCVSWVPDISLVAKFRDDTACYAR